MVVMPVSAACTLLPKNVVHNIPITIRIDKNFLFEIFMKYALRMNALELQMHVIQY